MKSQADTSDIVRSVGLVKSRARQGSLAVHIVPTIKTSFGLRSLPPRPMLRVSLTPAELHTLIRAIERDAEAAEQDGRSRRRPSRMARSGATRDGTMMRPANTAKLTGSMGSMGSKLAKPLELTAFRSGGAGTPSLRVRGSTGSRSDIKAINAVALSGLRVPFERAAT